MEKKYTIDVACQGVVFHVALEDDASMSQDEAVKFCEEIQKGDIEFFTFETNKEFLVTLGKEQLKNCVWWAEPIE